MIKKLTLLVVMLLVSMPVFAETVDTAWVRRYNGPGTDYDEAYVIAVDDSGNVYVAGYSYNSVTSEDYVTIKYYPDGDTAWVRTYNGPGNGDDEANAITVDDSENVYVTGYSTGSATGYDYATIKYLPNGDTAWVRRYNGPGNDRDDDARAIAVDDSGYVYVTGLSDSSSTDRDYATIKYYPNGDTVWIRRYYGQANIATAIALDISNNVYVTGTTYSSETRNDYATIKYYPNGDTAWVRVYNGPANGWDIAFAVALDNSNNVYVSGYSTGSGSGNDYATVKYYLDGDTAWTRRYNGPGNGADVAKAIALDDSNNLYVTGYSYGSGTSADYATIKYYPNGDTVWLRRYNGPGNSNDYSYAIAIDDSGNIYVAGYSNSSETSDDYTTIKYYPNGDTAWVRRYNGPGNSGDWAYAIDRKSVG
jgi:hypothetical protein